MTAVRITNASRADHELAPGTGFLRPGEEVEYSAEEWAKHKPYATSRLAAGLIRKTEIGPPARRPDETKRP